MTTTRRRGGANSRSHHMLLPRVDRRKCRPGGSARCVVSFSNGLGRGWEGEERGGVLVLAYVPHRNSLRITFCALHSALQVTGLIGRYKDPNSGLSFANASAGAQLKETPPPWLQLSGNAPYFEAMRFIKQAAAADDGDGDKAAASGSSAVSLGCPSSDT